jgi:hypothetical protein
VVNGLGLLDVRPAVWGWSYTHFRLSFFLPASVFEGESAAVLEIAAHYFPPMVALRGLYVHKLNAQPPFAAMADDGAHLQLPGGMIAVNAEMNFNFRSRGVLNLTQDTDANWAQVCQEASHELVRWAKQDAPIGGAPGAASPFGRWIVGQSSNRISPSRGGKLLARGCLRRLTTNC